MLESPNLAFSDLMTCVATAYALQPAALDFLPIGYDATAWAFAVTGSDGARSFLKLKRDSFPPASLAVPRALADAGMGEIVAPLAAKSGALQVPCDGYSLALYPFIVGEVGMEVGLTSAQWTTLGAALRRVHDVRLSESVAAQVGRAHFTSPWLATVRDVAAHLTTAPVADPVEREFAALWQTQRVRIDHIVTRTEALGRALRQRTPPFVLCHADIHTANTLVDRAGRLHIVDWDGVIFAPKERDLMFLLGNTVDGVAQPHWQEVAFQAGYGAVTLDPLALAYYRYEWVVQELGDFGARICLAEDGGDLTRTAALDDFRQLFNPGDVVDGALAADRDDLL